MKGVVGEYGESAQSSTDEPEQVRVVVVQDVACCAGSNGGWNCPGESEDRHVTSAHNIGGKVRGERLAGWYNNHFTDGDNNDVECK